jgi:hypothetical protein
MVGGGASDSWLGLLPLVLLLCAPPLGLVNVFFSIRDWRRGRSIQALVGLCLSALAILAFVPALGD